MPFNGTRSGSSGFLPMGGVGFGWRFGALGCRLNIFDRYRRKIITSDLHVDDCESFAWVGGVQGLAEFGDGIGFEAGTAPITRQLRIGPRRDLEQVAAVGDRAENSPSAVVDEDDDRIHAEAWRVGDLGAVHLKTAIAAKDDRPQANANLGAERGRYGKAHRGVKPLGQIGALMGHAHVESAE